MNQRTFFDDEFKADLSAKHTGTSKQAYDSIQPVLNELESTVYAAIQKRGNATCDEIECDTGMAHQTCSARFRGLALKGVIKRTGERRKTRSGRAADVWEVTR